jgi:thiol-disulfide isomerase/thioredoxin
MDRVLLVLGVLAVATAVGLWWRASNGRYTAVDPAVVDAAHALPEAVTGNRLTADQIGAPLGEKATFVQFSSEVCAPCRRTHAVLQRLVGDVEGVAHVELDVVEHLDLVRIFDVMRTPTLLVLDSDGVVRGRMSGATDRHHAVIALEAVTGEHTPRHHHHRHHEHGHEGHHEPAREGRHDDPPQQGSRP